jgi:plastocyanin
LRKLLPLVALIAAVLAGPATAAAPKPTTATLKDDYFVKGKLTVKKGTTVVWKWKTDDEHTVTDLNGRFGSKQTSHGTFKHRFKKKGTFTVYCLVHPEEMRQKVIVK